MNQPPYDQNIANLAAAADQCMSLGAVILKPTGTQPVGFHVQAQVSEGARAAIAEQAKRQARSAPRGLPGRAGILP